MTLMRLIHSPLCIDLLGIWRKMSFLLNTESARCTSFITEGLICEMDKKFGKWGVESVLRNRPQEISNSYCFSGVGELVPKMSFLIQLWRIAKLQHPLAVRVNTKTQETHCFLSKVWSKALESCTWNFQRKYEYGRNIGQTGKGGTHFTNRGLKREGSILPCTLSH